MTHAPQPWHQPRLTSTTSRPHPVNAATRAPRRHRRPRWYRTLVNAVVITAAVAVTGCRAADPPPVGPAGPVAPPLVACTKPGPLPCDARDPLHEVYSAGQMFASGINGAGTTIAVIVPGISNGLGGDLAVFDRYYRLPAAQLQVISWDNPPALSPRVAAYWDQEAVLDLEMAHFMAPAAHLLLVGIPASTGACDTGELRTAMTALGALAAPRHITVASFSWGTDEAALTACGASQQLAAIRPGLQTAVAAGVSVIAGSGDSGPTGPTPADGYYHYRTVPYPTSDPLVTGVGATTISSTPHHTLTQTVGRETYHGQTYTGGGGLSALFPRPAWQDSVAAVTGSHRGVVDVSMDAQAWAYIKVPGLPASPGWLSAWGTSVSAPLFADLAADAAQKAGHPLGLINPALYQMHGTADGVLDITNTDDGVTGYPAGPGYDLPTGIGTISNATLFVTTLTRIGQHS